MVCELAPWPRLNGETEDALGPGAVILNPPAKRVVPASGLVTVTLRLPVVAPADTLTLTVTCVALFTIVELIVMPEPLKLTDAPFTKFAPVITMF